MCIWLAAASVTVASLVLYAASVWFGNLNQDEGWYLYAARAVADGRLPYRDFFFTQGPVMPYLYGVFAPFWSPHGVLGGRIFTAVLGLLSGVLAAGLARRAVPSPRAAEAGLIAFALTACNLYHVYFTTIPKTYALASCLLLGGFLVLTLSLSRRRKTRSHLSCMWALPAGMLVAFAAGVRLSLGAMLPVTVLALLISYRKTGAAFFWFALGGAWVWRWRSAPPCWRRPKFSCSVSHSMWRAAVVIPSLWPVRWHVWCRPICLRYCCWLL